MCIPLQSEKPISQYKFQQIYNFWLAEGSSFFPLDCQSSVLTASVTNLTGMEVKSDITSEDKSSSSSVNVTLVIAL